MRITRVGLVLGLIIAASACGGDDDASTTTAPVTTPPLAEPASTVATTSPTTTAAPTTTTATTNSPTTTDAPATTMPPTTVAPATTSLPPTKKVDAKVYLLRGERLAITHRDVIGPAVLRAALSELIAGPTASERGDGLHTEIPTGTQLLDVNLDDGLATVDLSREFEAGGGTLSMTARVAEIVFTATQFDNVDRVRFWLEGEPIDSLGGEGLMMTDPWSRSQVDRAVSGSVLIDTPAYGATVGNPITVTGEGDVFEAQFPIEIWRGGELVGGAAPVTAGAWGEWAEFEVVLTLDTGAGPIELIAYDPGGCGDAPECPEIIRTIVPLMFAG